eukprot:CAMPEP_0197832944 /NCGR_PEP_ID=MMETSP1437-20131217/17058_1 /TAXON_ID=49252 ORGANISM="Eucampia antarctica, Strain CCMP1452" /NCGR_SAMPLE_ID=MMETSP1437 /ASSEMBLY_ACC=CAM_ASM_001096 /LENGTH=221 /DNA_ID=CAMNT_0043436629 /DNA_START=45 /DNA_END=710 /DNA_ORIENTATION=+
MKNSSFLFLTYTGITSLLLSPYCFIKTDAFVPVIQRYYFKAQLRDACQIKDKTKIDDIVEELSKLNPTSDIRSQFSKLDGEWKLDFTTALTTEVPDEQKSGVITYQTVDTDKGIIYNVIDRGLPEKGAKIAVGIEPTRSGRVALDFRTIEAFNDKFPKRILLKFPPRDLVKVVYKIGKILSGKEYDELEFKEANHFDLLYLDDDLRIQRNSEGNLFVNSRR